MIVTVTQYGNFDPKSEMIPTAQHRINSMALAAVGNFPALDPKTKLIRVASDTGVKLTFNGADPVYFPPNAPELYAVMGKEVITVALT